MKGILSMPMEVEAAFELVGINNKTKAKRQKKVVSVLLFISIMDTLISINYQPFYRKISAKGKMGLRKGTPSRFKSHYLTMQLSRVCEIISPKWIKKAHKDPNVFT